MESRYFKILLAILLLVSSSSTVYSAENWFLYNKVKGDLSSDHVYFIEQLSEEELIVGTHGGGISKLNVTNGRSEFISAFNTGLSNNYIKAFHVDEDGNIFIGSNNGIDILYNDGNWENINKWNSPLLSDEITAITTSKKGDLWVATDLTGVFHRDVNGEWTIYNSFNSRLPSNNIKDIVIGENGEVWFSSYPRLTHISHIGGAACLKPDGTWTVYNTNNSNLPSNRVNSITLDNAGGVWFATMGGAAYMDPDGKWTVYTRFNSKLTDNEIRRIALDSRGYTWLATWGGGLASISDKGSWKIYNTNTSRIVNNHIHTIHIDSEDNIWLGTNLGLNKYSPRAGEVDLNPDIIEVFYNGRLLNFDVEPIMDSGTTFVPLRVISDELGFNSEWDENLKEVKIKSRSSTIKLTIDSKKAYRNNEEFTLYASPRIIGNRTLVPVRFISESLRKQVIWDNNTRTVYILDYAI